MVSDPSSNEYFCKASSELQGICLMNDLVKTNTLSIWTLKKFGFQKWINAQPVVSGGSWRVRRTTGFNPWQGGRCHVRSRNFSRWILQGFTIVYIDSTWWYPLGVARIGWRFSVSFTLHPLGINRPTILLTWAKINFTAHWCPNRTQMTLITPHGIIRFVLKAVGKGITLSLNETLRLRQEALHSPHGSFQGKKKTNLGEKF